MAEEHSEKPDPPELPDYLQEPLERQPVDRLEAVAVYASELAEWKRERNQRETEQRRSEDAVDEAALERLEERKISTEPEEYEDVPASAYVTVKETKPGYRYFYWQWRDGDAWKNEYIGPVEPTEEE
jgi:hypothetical protein